MAAVFRRYNLFSKKNANKQNDWKKSSLQTSIRGVIILAQIFALMPFNGVTSNDVNKISFKWFSLKMVYCFVSILGSLGLAVMNFIRFLKTGMHFGDFVAVLFYLSGILSMSLFIKIASKWLFLSKKWFDVEKSMHKYKYQPNIRRRFIITTITVMFLALGEHLLFISKVVNLTFTCPLMRTNPIKAYFGAAFSQIFAATEYSLWKAILIEALNILATFVWNFMDLFIMLMCTALAEKFKQINKRVQTTDVKTDLFWKEIREHYNSLSLLCDDLDDTICHLITLSFANNLFFICVQLFNYLQPLHGVIDTLYFFVSFGFLLARTASVSVYASWINDESRVLLPILFEIPEDDYGAEARRLVLQMSTSSIAISGSKYFFITRSLCLTVAGAIITFELILQQITPYILNTQGDNTEETVFCVN